jgi:hypothetical protein
MNSLSEEQLMQKTMDTRQDALLDTAKQLLLEWMAAYEKTFDSDENQPIDDMIRYLHTFDLVTLHIGHEPTPWQARIYIQTQAYVEHSKFI